MDLRTASNYFSGDPISGWDGTSWVSNVGSVTFLPYDRFISAREFGSKRRHILSDPSLAFLDTYKVIRFDSTGEIFLVGVTNYDVREGSAYSQVNLIHRAQYFGDITSFTKTMSASGMPSAVVRNTIGQYYCDVERVTYTKSKEFDKTHFTEVFILLPDYAVVDTGDELVIGDRYFDIQETYTASGFVECRALEKRSI